MRDLYSNDVETAATLAGHDADGYDDRPTRREFDREEFDAFMADPKRQALVERILEDDE